MILDDGGDATLYIMYWVPRLENGEILKNPSNEEETALKNSY